MANGTADAASRREIQDIAAQQHRSGSRSSSAVVVDAAINEVSCPPIWLFGWPLTGALHTNCLPSSFVLGLCFFSFFVVVGAVLNIQSITPVFLYSLFVLHVSPFPVVSFGLPVLALISRVLHLE